MAENKFFKNLRATGMMSGVGPLQAISALAPTVANAAQNLTGANFMGAADQLRNYGAANQAPTQAQQPAIASNPLTPYTGATQQPVTSQSYSYSSPSAQLPRYMGSTPAEDAARANLTASKLAQSQDITDINTQRGMKTLRGVAGQLGNLNTQYNQTQQTYLDELGLLSNNRKEQNSFNQSNFDNEMALYNANLSAQKANADSAATQAAQLTSGDAETQRLLTNLTDLKGTSGANRAIGTGGVGLIGKLYGKASGNTADFNAKLNQLSGYLQTKIAQANKGQGTVSDYERKLYGTLTGLGKEQRGETFWKEVESYQTKQGLTTPTQTDSILSKYGL